MAAPTPPIIIEPFGANAAGSYIQLPIPVPSQLPANPGRASFNDGFPSDTMGAGGVPPYGQDMNGILYTVTAYAQALTGGQFWPYNPTWSAANSGYAIGAMVAMANGLGLWLNTVANNTNNPDTFSPAASSGWVPVNSYGSTSITVSSGTVTLTPVQAACKVIVLTGTLSGNVTVIFPPWVKDWIVINNTTPSTVDNINCKTASGTGVLLPISGGAMPLASDGVNIIGPNGAISTFTATLTGVSPTVTGTATYTVINGIVFLTLPALSGASDSTACTITGLPAAIQSVSFLHPTSGIFGWALLENDGAFLYGNWSLNGTTITLSTTATGAGFSATGQKGILPMTLTYPMAQA